MILLDKHIGICASLSCADLLNVEKNINELLENDITWIHYDVADGVFAECFIMGEELIKLIKRKYRINIEVHLAVYEIEKYAGIFAAAGADVLAVHYEVLDFPLKTIAYLRNLGVRVVIAFKADTDVPADFLAVARQVDGILKLGVNPGFPGQIIQPAALTHTRKMRKILADNKLSVPIEFDGNVNEFTIGDIVHAGADWVTGGSSGLFNRELPVSIAALERAIQRKER